MTDMTDKETAWDKLLKIKTSGRDDSMANHINYPYEPTPYTVLERLAGSEYIGKHNTLLDYGCGKGRVDFFMAYQTGCRSIGIDYDERLVRAAQKNKEKAVTGSRVQMIQANAVSFAVPREVDRCYFFNPFSVEVLQGVMGRICESYYVNPREIQLFFYYPSDEYIAWLMTRDELMFNDEISCMDLFKGEDPRERILMFSVIG